PRTFHRPPRRRRAPTPRSPHHRRPGLSRHRHAQVVGGSRWPRCARDAADQTGARPRRWRRSDRAGPDRPQCTKPRGPLAGPGVIMNRRMKVNFTTLGCPKNQVDSELMLGMLARAGHEVTERAEEAECLVVNTCAFIDRAREESVNTILELGRLKAGGRARSLVVTGCLTQRYGGEILAEMPEVDAILGTSELPRIVELVNQADGRRDWVTSAPPGYLYDAATPRLLSARVPYAYVKIAEGCDMGCTFCA